MNMSNIKIESTLENKKNQKTSIHNSSSAVFFALHNPIKDIDTEISLLNHFYSREVLKTLLHELKLEI